MEEYKVMAHSESETKRIAQSIVKRLNPGDIVTLSGELGAGKTTFTKGIAEGLAIRRPVTSPTFTIIKEYEGNIPLYHMDAYRLEHSEEDIGFDEYFFGKGISVVEWAHFIEDFLPEERLNIEINYIDEHSRTIRFDPIGEYYKKVIKKFMGEDSKK